MGRPSRQRDCHCALAALRAASPHCKSACKYGPPGGVTLQEQLNLALAQRYTASREKFYPDQDKTAKANGLEPYRYLWHLFTELPKAETVEGIEVLLPGNIETAQLKSI